jgi:hypothetical protein
LVWVGLVVGDCPLFGCDCDGPGFDRLGDADGLGVGDGATTGLGVIVGVGVAPLPAVDVAFRTVADATG